MNRSGFSEERHKPGIEAIIDVYFLNIELYNEAIVSAFL